MQGKDTEVGDGESSSDQIEVTSRSMPAKHRDHLEVDEFGRGKRLTTEPIAKGASVLGVVDQHGDEDARVKDEHGPP